MRRKFQKIIFACVTFVFTLFVFLNTYEVVFNKNVTFADSIRKMTTQDTINTVVREFATKTQTDEINASASLDAMEYLEIPSLDVHLRIEESRKIDGQWYERPGVIHRVGLNKNQHGATVDYLLYGTKSWRTMTNPDRIEDGATVDLYYGGAASTFVVADKKVLPIGQSLIAPTSEVRQLLLVLEDPAEGVFYGYSLELKK